MSVGEVRNAPAEGGYVRALRRAGSADAVPRSLRSAFRLISEQASARGAEGATEAEIDLVKLLPGVFAHDETAIAIAEALASRVLRDNGYRAPRPRRRR